MDSTKLQSYCSGQVPRLVLCSHLQRDRDQLQDHDLQRVGEGRPAPGHCSSLRPGSRNPGLRQGFVFRVMFFNPKTFVQDSLC